ncbi:hypothetical protein, partial [Thermodesulfitimonas sp.]
KAPAFYQGSRYKMILAVKVEPYNPISGKKKHPKLFDSVNPEHVKQFFRARGLSPELALGR